MSSQRATFHAVQHLSDKSLLDQAIRRDEDENDIRTATSAGSL